MSTKLRPPTHFSQTVANKVILFLAGGGVWRVGLGGGGSFFPLSCFVTLKETCEVFAVKKEYLFIRFCVTFVSRLTSSSSLSSSPGI